jgi:hypothetical protein
LKVVNLTAVVGLVINLPILRKMSIISDVMFAIKIAKGIVVPIDKKLKPYRS